MARPSKVTMGQVSDVDLRLLRVFRAVVESGGFTQAEVALNVTSSAISISMSDLEKRLGLRLCQRGRTGFSLTDEGRAVYRAAQQLNHALEEFKSEVHGIQQQLRGEFRISITDNLVSSPRMRITHSLKELKQLGPDINIRIQMIAPHEIEASLVNGAIHVGVIPLVQKLKSLDYLPLYRENVQLYCSDLHPLFDLDDSKIELEQLQQVEAIDCAFAQPQQAMEYLCQLKRSASATDREGIAFLILSGLYIGFLPEHYAQRWVAEGRMRPLRSDIMSYDIEYAIATRKGVQPNLVVDTFLSAIKNHRKD